MLEMKVPLMIRHQREAIAALHEGQPVTLFGHYSALQKAAAELTRRIPEFNVVFDGPRGGRRDSVMRAYRKGTEPVG